VAPAGEQQGGEEGSQAAIRGHIYWTNPETSRGSGGPGIDTLGRADLNGTSVEKSFITDVVITGAIALDSGHIYWTNPEAGAIGRADLAGAHVDQSFISVGGAVGALAVGGGHICLILGGEKVLGATRLCDIPQFNSCKSEGGLCNSHGPPLLDVAGAQTRQ
jgi:hypothetical protein